MQIAIMNKSKAAFMPSGRGFHHPGRMYAWKMFSVVLDSGCGLVICVYIVRSRFVGISAGEILSLIQISNINEIHT